jgi:DnaD/phage-associated family protein
MKSDYWIKLYHEILDDPKMGTLPDRLWRRLIELFLLAGRLCPDKSGILPDTAQIAWCLRVPADQLEEELQTLTNLGFVERHCEGWLVVNFQKRQAPLSASERGKRYRQKHGGDASTSDSNDCNNERNANEKRTKNERIVRRLTETESESESELINATSSSAQNEKKSRKDSVFRDYEKEIGLLTPKIAEEIKSAQEDYPDEWISAAIGEAARNNARSWAYVAAVLRRWKKDGFKVNKKQPTTAQNSTADDEYNQMLERVSSKLAERYAKQNGRYV